MVDRFVLRPQGGSVSETQTSSVLDRLGAVKDAMTVGRAFGDSYQVDGVTIIPVATVRGGGGGGSGSGTAPETGKESTPGEKAMGSGEGLGFGAVVRPVGVVVVKDGTATWQPTIDVMRIILGGQLLALAAILVFGRRRRH
jgi:uncharacterized spore protein YtfJ